jgi:hypothetical protein
MTPDEAKNVYLTILGGGLAIIALKPFIALCCTIYILIYGGI